MRDGSQRTRRGIVIAAAIGATVSIVSAGILVFAHSWVPLGDHGIFAVRARDVFSTHPPLVGTWTSASLSLGVNLNNPGPLYYDAIALPTLIVGSAGAGVAVGVAIVNAICGLATGLVARRQGGWLAGCLAFLVVAVLAWTLGSDILIDPTQPAAMLMPLLLFVVLVWSVTRGDVVLLPLLVAVASLILQTYVTYVFIVGMLSVLSVVGVWLWLRGAGYARDRVARVRRAAQWSLVVAVACWAQPVWQQLFGPGPGNLARLWRAARAPGRRRRPGHRHTARGPGSHHAAVLVPAVVS